jgi:acyl carrier protein
MAIREEAVELLVKKAAVLFGKDPASLGADTRFIEDLQAKSVNFVQLSAALEEEYEVEVPYMEFRKKKTFGEAADYIAKMFGE